MPAACRCESGSQSSRAKQSKDEVQADVEPAVEDNMGESQVPQDEQPDFEPNIASTALRRTSSNWSCQNGAAHTFAQCGS